MSDQPASLAPVPEGYAVRLADLGPHICQAQHRAGQRFNSELTLLYWQIGHDIHQRMEEQGYGGKVVERQGHDLRSACPDMTGFSPRNLREMWAFAQVWPDHLGQLKFYMTAVDADFKSGQDAPRLSLILCQDQDEVVAEYALRDESMPMHIAPYELSEALPDELKTNLPSIEPCERELEQSDD